ncbi:MAG: pyridoxamine 5'-phosphate oxidase family protein [Burkholderiaceae bacterium]
MDSATMFNTGSRQLQRQFDTVKLADRIIEKLAHTKFTSNDSEFIQSRSLFFLSTADSNGHPDCSYKGGDPGFVRVLDATTLAFPSYDGNGMFISLGNIQVNPNIGLLFIDFESPRRLRVNGRATVSLDDELMSEFHGAQAIVRVVPEVIFPNCPRYIHQVQTVSKSENIPRKDYVPPQPEWKTRPHFNEVLPDSDPAKKQ